MYEHILFLRVRGNIIRRGKLNIGINNNKRLSIVCTIEIRFPFVSDLTKLRPACHPRVSIVFVCTLFWYLLCLFHFTYLGSDIS